MAEAVASLTVAIINWQIHFNDKQPACPLMMFAEKDVFCN